MKKYFQNHKELFLRSFKMKNFLITFFSDVVFYSLFFGIFSVFSSIIKTMYVNLDTNAASISEFNIANTTAMNAMIEKYFAYSIFLLLIVILLLFVLFVLVKGFIYSRISSRKCDLHYFNRYSRFNLLWLLISIIPFLFVILLLTYLQQISLEFLKSGLYFSILFLMILMFIIMISNLIFQKKLMFNSIGIGFSTSFNLRLLHFPIIMVLVMFFAITFIWTQLSRIIGLANIYFPVYLILILLIITWSRDYFWLYLKH